MQLRLLVQGRVQGVGFRPSVYRLASSLGLGGYVRNIGDGNVEIVIEGEPSSVDDFLERFEDGLPPLAEVVSLQTEQVSGPRLGPFRILESKPGRSSSHSFIPQDVATCERCLHELFNPKDRRFRYPFISCTDCGPRFTISRGPPFDRDNTSMRPFSLCSRCEAEYSSPLDRRYHAQTIACPACGPKVSLLDASGTPVDCDDPISEAARLIDDGEIVAVKGIGGTHIACRTTDDSVVSRLREELSRPAQPFAVMARDLAAVETFARVSEPERRALIDWKRPIVVLDKRDPFALSELLAPDLPNIGVMLPYTPLHHLLLSQTSEPALVMTSANPHGQPMITQLDRLRMSLPFLEHVLWHNLEIVNRCDDSVMRFHGQSRVLIRRSRGFVPHPIDLGWRDERIILGVGPELCSTACVCRDGQAFLTQHIGDTSEYDTFSFLREAISTLMRNLGIDKVDIVAHDRHPEFYSTRLAEELSRRWECPAVSVQHHFAHLYSLMAERKIDPSKRVMGIVCDGVGYGTAREAWGGEVLGISPDGESRLGSLQPQPMIGGDLAAMYPTRMAIGILSRVMTEKRIRGIVSRFCRGGLPRGQEELDLVFQQLRSGFNVSLTTSTGRILDAISAILGISLKRTYEGEGAMRLEGVASRGDPRSVDLRVEVYEKEGRFVFDTTPLLLDVVSAMERNTPRRHIAAAAQEAVGKGLAEMAKLCAESFDPDVIGCSGGVMYNRHIVSVIERELDRDLVKHVQLPAGDGCISLGQAMAAQVRTHS